MDSETGNVTDSALKVYHINTFDYGGAFNAAYRLHEGMVRESVHSHFGVKHQRHPSLNTYKLSSDSGFAAKCHSRLDKLVDNRFFKLGKRRRPVRLEKQQTYVSDSFTDFRIDFSNSFSEPDLFHFHWIAHLIDWPYSLHRFTDLAPIVWTIHDLNPMKGIWHYTPFDSERNKRYDALDEDVFQIKRSVVQGIPKDRIHLVAPSKWMLSEIRKSEVFDGFQSTHIPSGFASDLFSPINKSKARSELGLPSDCILGGFIAGDLGEFRKGYDQVLEATNKLNTSKFKLVVAGNGSDRFPSDENTIYIGQIEDQARLNLFYSSLDFLICASYEDNLPNTVMEGLAAGTPTLGFKRGGIPDMVEDGVSGWLVDDESTLDGALTQLVGGSVDFPEYARRAREHFEREFVDIKAIERYHQLYQQITSTSQLI